MSVTVTEYSVLVVESSTHYYDCYLIFVDKLLYPVAIAHFIQLNHNIFYAFTGEW